MPILQNARRFACLLAIPLLTSCLIYTNHSFAGKRRIDQQNHWIELTVGEIARNDENKWSLFGGVGQHAGAYGINTFKFSVGLPSYQPPPPFEVLQVKVICNKRWPLKLYRLPKDQEEEQKPFDNSAHELWVESLPSPTHLPHLIPDGAYQIKIHYRLGNEEYDAEWQCIYKTKLL